MTDLLQNIVIVILILIVYRMSQLILLQREVQKKLHEMVGMMFKWQIKRQ